LGPGSALVDSTPQHHSDVTDVRQIQACARHPAGWPALISREAGHPDALRILTGHMGHQVCDRLSLNRLPWPGKGGDKAPAPGRVVGLAWQHHLAIVLRAIRGLARHDTPLGPRGRDKATPHLTEQGIVCLILWMVFRPNEPKGSWQTLDVPCCNQQRKADTARPGMMLIFKSFLDQGILRSPLGFLTAITHQMEESRPWAAARYAGLPRPTQLLAYGYSNSSPSASGGNVTLCWPPGSSRQVLLRFSAPDRGLACRPANTG